MSGPRMALGQNRLINMLIVSFDLELEGNVTDKEIQEAKMKLAAILNWRRNQRKIIRDAAKVQR